MVLLFLRRLLSFNRAGPSFHNDFPGLGTHRMLQDEFKKTLYNLVEDFREEGASHALAEAIDTMLVNWLFKHIRIVDVEFGKFLKSKGIALVEKG